MRNLSGLVFVAVMSLVPTLAAAYPIPPQPLRKLTRESDLIVVAKVDSITEQKSQDGKSFDSAIAHLLISTVVKGAVNSMAIDVSYPAGLICPAPPHYQEGETVLVFLALDEKTNRYYTVGLSYGAKSLKPKQLDTYVARIRELVEIEKQTDKEIQQKQMIEWLVQCAEDPATRWEGAYELSYSHELNVRIAEAQKAREKDRKARTEVATGEGPDSRKEAADNGEEEEGDDKIEESRDLTELLTDEQKARLANALYRSSLRQMDMSLISLIELFKDKDLIPFLWSTLKAAKDAEPYFTHSLMSKVAAALNNKTALELTKPFFNLLFSNNDQVSESKNERERQAILEKFIVEIEKAGAPKTMEINNSSKAEDEDTKIVTTDDSGKSGYLMAILMMANKLLFSLCLL